MTLENWNDLLYAGLRNSVNKALVLVYYISWIFIGNYALLNLFLAVLLDGFEEDNLDDISMLKEDFEIAADISLHT